MSMFGMWLFRVSLHGNEQSLNYFVRVLKCSSERLYMVKGGLVNYKCDVMTYGQQAEFMCTRCLLFIHNRQCRIMLTFSSSPVLF